MFSMWDYENLNFCTKFYKFEFFKIFKIFKIKKVTPLIFQKPYLNWIDQNFDFWPKSILTNKAG